MTNVITLKNLNKAIFPPKSKITNNIDFSNLQRELKSLGYFLSQDSLDHLKRVKVEDINIFLTRLINDICEITGAGKDYKPLFVNFPISR